MNARPIHHAVGSCLLGITLLVGAGANAGTMLYSYDDSSAIPGFFQAGSGTFCLDVGSALGTYVASDVTGSGGALRDWVGFAFRANLGTQPSIVISDGFGSSIITLFPGSSGGDLQADDVASVEWAHFIASAQQVGIVITEIGPCATPEGGSTLLMTMAALGGLIGLARSARFASPRTAHRW